MRRALVVATLLFAGACARHEAARTLPPDEAKTLLNDRSWVDRLPTRVDDKLHVFRFTPKMGGGVYQDRTLFKGTFELFTFKVDGDHIDFTMPETHEQVRSQFQIDKVAGPKPFDLKLTIWSDPRGPHEYYGIRAEKDVDGSKLVAELQAVR